MAQDVADRPPETEAARPAAIEQIIVTAQKREQTLREVPISLSVVGFEFMKEQGITDFRDLALYVPNASINLTSGQFNDIRVRGFGSPIGNKAFEQAVGVVIDGIPYTRLPYWQAGLFDLERVEVLRGPQGTLFGKNTTAGLFNVVTRKPTDELTGYVEGVVGELDERRLEAAVGGPLIADVVNVRLSGVTDERDGTLENTTARFVADAAERMNARDRKGGRIQLGFPDLFGADLVLGYEAVQSDTNGAGWEFSRVVPNQIPFFRYWDPDVDFRPGNWIGGTDGSDYTKATIQTLVANGGYDLAGWGLDLVAGYSVMKWRFHADEDFTPARYFQVGDRDDNFQSVVELRASPPSLPGFLGLGNVFGFDLGSTSSMVGFFFDERKIEDGRQDNELNGPIVAQGLATDATGVVPPCPGCGFEQSDVFSIGFDQTSTSLAGFGQMSWVPAERWTLEYGMRFTREQKDAAWRTECTHGECAVFAALLQGEEFTEQQSRSEFAFTPKVTLRYDLTPDVGFYVGWGKGFKGGGFNSNVFNDNSPFNLAFRPEKSTSWEVGAKASFLDGTASLNVALYRQDVTDLQVFVVPANFDIRVSNAGESRSQGVEADATWLPADWLTMRGTFAFIDTEYLSFEDGTCPMDRPNEDGDENGLCDLGGRPFEFTPRWTATVTPSVRFPIADVPGVGVVAPLSVPGIDLIGGLSVEYKDHYFANGILDPRTRQPSFIRLGANLGLANAGHGWSLRVVGENLTDEDVAVHIRDISVLGKSFSQVLDPPRLVRGELRWEF